MNFLSKVALFLIVVAVGGGGGVFGDMGYSRAFQDC